MNFKSIFTEYLPVFLSASSIVLSIFHWLYDRKREQAKIVVEERGFLPDITFSSNREYTIFCLIIKNQSKFDIAITRMFLKSEDKVVEFEWHHNIKVTAFRKEINSTPLPLHILGLSAYGGYFFIPKSGIDMSKLCNNPFIIEIQTSRGYTKEFQFEKINPKINI